MLNVTNEKVQLDLLLGEKSFEKIADAIPDIVARFDLNYRHLFVNLAIEEVAGRPRTEFINKTNRELGMPEELVNLWHKHLEKTITTCSEQEIEFEFKDTVGESRFFHAVSAPELSTDGQVMSVVMITRDITQKKKAIDHSVVSAKNSTLKKFSAELAHQLNNPLAVVVGRMGLLQKDIRKFEIETEPLLNHFKIIYKSIDRMKSIISKMGEFAEAQSSSEKMDASWQISEIVASAISICEERMLHIGVRKEVLTNSDRRITTRFFDLTEATFEILANAFEASKIADDPWVRVEVNHKEAWLEISITDSGSGIPKENIGQMMHPFFTTKGPDRTGLGLSTAKSKINGLGGQVVFDEDAKNTTFKIILPLS